MSKGRSRRTRLPARAQPSALGCQQSATSP
jgi:hypothetical protein